jgi:hypothetical protein
MLYISHIIFIKYKNWLRSIACKGDFSLKYPSFMFNHGDQQEIRTPSSTSWIYFLGMPTSKPSNIWGTLQGLYKPSATWVVSQPHGQNNIWRIVVCLIFVTKAIKFVSLSFVFSYSIFFMKITPPPRLNRKILIFSAAFRFHNILFILR